LHLDAHCGDVTGNRPRHDSGRRPPIDVARRSVERGVCADPRAQFFQVNRINIRKGTAEFVEDLLAIVEKLERGRLQEPVDKTSLAPMFGYGRKDKKFCRASAPVFFNHGLDSVARVTKVRCYRDSVVAVGKAVETRRKVAPVKSNDARVESGEIAERCRELSIEFSDAADDDGAVRHGPVKFGCQIIE